MHNRIDLEHGVHLRNRILRRQSLRAFAFRSLLRPAEVPREQSGERVGRNRHVAVSLHVALLVLVGNRVVLGPAHFRRLAAAEVTHGAHRQVETARNVNTERSVQADTRSKRHRVFEDIDRVLFAFYAELAGKFDKRDNPVGHEPVKARRINNSVRAQVRVHEPALQVKPQGNVALGKVKSHDGVSPHHDFIRSIGIGISFILKHPGMARTQANFLRARRQHHVQLHRKPENVVFGQERCRHFHEQVNIARTYVASRLQVILRI